MEKDDVFNLIHTMELFTNQAIVKWTKTFPYQISISAILVLSELKLNGPQRQSDLANSLGFTPGAVTNISNRLIKEGYAERQFDNNDRRVIFLRITDQGKKVVKEAHERGKQLHLELFKVLSKSEIQNFLAIYQKLLKQSQSV